MTYDENGENVGQVGTIRTWSGLRVDPLDMRPEDLSVEDVAHSLARLCRYNGHCRYLSVARHSIWVSQHLAPRGRTLALWGLLHDAAEAYLSDIPRPLKHGEVFEQYREAEERLDRVIAEAFDLPWPMPPEVHDADRHVLLEVELNGGRRDNYEGDFEADEQDFLDRYAFLRGHVPAPRGILVGLAGYAQSGKDTVAKILEPQGFERIAFADGLREFAYALNPVVPIERGKFTGPLVFEHRRLADVVVSLGWERAKTDLPEVRQLLQRLGTEAGRAILGSNVWIDLALRDVKPGGRYVVTDVRFPNEYEAIKARGGEVWRVVRPGTGAANGHASESALADHKFDRVIVNDGTRVDLRRNVTSVFTPA